MNGVPLTPDRLARNGLGASASPYLRQHAGNPVHWQEWTDEALAWAAERDVPILLSVGYAACHWCHVMAHESFDDPATAAVMNDNFVCIKVDREERPDIDAIYMNATVAMTGQGGWPMTCFLTPQGEPFYCGTYFPPQARSGMPSFTQILMAVTQAWTQRREEVLAVGAKLGEHLGAASHALPAEPVDDALLATAVESVLAEEDPVSGGFGGAPKFPPSALLEGLLRANEYVGDQAALDAATRTCEAMARGGIHDQLAGGFARYAVDNDWVVPHFEKMLYDNAQLLRVYAHLARRTGDPLAIRVTEGIVDFLVNDLRVGDGFASSLDADTDGVEGLTYVWTRQQLADALGEDDGRWAAEVFTVTDAGTFEHGTSTLQLLTEPDDPQRLASVRERLMAVRAERPQPARDDKVVTAWNAMTVTALAEAGAGLHRTEWIELARQCASSLVSDHIVDGRVRRVSLGGVVGLPAGALDDHAALVTALLTLAQATGDNHWVTTALTILDAAIGTFADPDEPGSWFDAAGEGLVARPRDPVDGATPSGASLMAEALLIASTMAPAQDASRYADLLDATLGRCALVLARAPRSAGHWLAVAHAKLAGPIQIVVAETADSTHDLIAQVRTSAPGGAVVVAGERDSAPLLVARGPVNGKDAAYVCRGTVCSLPVTELDDEVVLR